MTCSKRTNVANSDVQLWLVTFYSQKPFVALYIKCSQKFCVIARFIHLGLRYCYYLSDVYVKAKYRFDCNFWLQSNGSGGCTAVCRVCLIIWIFI